MISPEDWDNLHVTDDAEEAVRLVVAAYESRSAESPAEPQRPTPSRAGRLSDAPPHEAARG